MDKSVKFRIELETKGEKALHMLSMDAKDFGDAVRSVVDEVKKSSEELERMSSNGISFMATLEAIESVRKAVADLSSDFNSFDKGMRAVNTMAGLNADGMDEMKGKVEEIAKLFRWPRMSWRMVCIRWYLTVFLRITGYRFWSSLQRRAWAVWQIWRKR